MAHIHKLIDFVANVYIVYQDKVLLIHHKTLNKWLPIGGHIELNEDPEQALYREVKEECGVAIELISEKPDITTNKTKLLPRPEFMDIHTVKDQHQHIAMSYFARAKTNKCKLNTEEHLDIKWFTAKDLSNPKYKILPYIQFFANAALRKATKVQ